MNRRTFLLTSAAALAAVPLRAAEPKLRVAIIGHTGRGHYGHGLDSMWAGLPETEVVAVADADPKGLAAAQAKLKLSRGFADYRQMLTEAKPDLVAIGPRMIGQHAAMAIAAAEAGAKGIYMEKPFVPTLGEAKAVLAALQQHGTKLALAHRNRYHPALKVVQEMIARGDLGRVLEVRGRGKEDQRGGGLDLWVLGSHVLNLAVIFTGLPVACTATLLQDGSPAKPADVRPGAEEVGPLAGNAVHARFETASGIPLFFDSIQGAGVKEANFGLQIIGTKGVVDLRVDTNPLAQFCAGNPHYPTAKPRQWQPISSAGVGVPEPIAGLAASVANHVLAARDLLAAIHENRAPLCSAEDGLLLVEMTMACFLSHTQNSARVTFPLSITENPLASWK